jgi:L-fuconolactonase
MLADAVDTNGRCRYKHPMSLDGGSAGGRTPAGSSELALIDTHLHLWDPSALRYPWLAGEPALDRPFLPADLDPGAHTIEGFIFVEAGSANGAAELAWVSRLARGWSPLLGVVAQAPLELGADSAPLLAQAASNPLTVGVRRNVQDEPAGFMLTESFVAGVRLLGTHGLPFDACVREHQLRELALLVDRCPEVMFVLDHLGKPGIAQRRQQPWFDDLSALARRPNIVAKLSGLTTEADRQRWGPADIAPYLTHALEEFGAGRAMFGSDWPVSTLATTYQRWLDLVLRVIDGLAGDERAAILSGTARRVYLGNHDRQELR